MQRPFSITFRGRSYRFALFGDGEVNLLDVAPFIDLLASGSFLLQADINEDGAVNLLDVEPFIDLLAG